MSLSLSFRPLMWSGWKCQIAIRSIALGSMPAARKSRRACRRMPRSPVPVSSERLQPGIDDHVVKGVASLSAGMNASAKACSTSVNGAFRMNLSVIGRYQMPS